MLLHAVLHHNKLNHDLILREIFDEILLPFFSMLLSVLFVYFTEFGIQYALNSCKLVNPFLFFFGVTLLLILRFQASHVL